MCIVPGLNPGGKLSLRHSKVKLIEDVHDIKEKHACALVLKLFVSEMNEWHETS